MDNKDKILNLFASLVPDADQETKERLVNIWSENDEIQRFLLWDDIPGEKSPIISTNSPDTPVEESPKKETPKKETPKSVEDQKFDPVKFLKANPDTPIKCIPENPKKPGSASYDFYERYKNATTLQEFLDSGGENKHIKYDFSKGFIHILDDSVENVIVETKKKSSPKKKIEKKKENKKKVEKKEKKVEKKEKKEKVEKKEKKVEKNEKIEPPIDAEKDESDTEEVTFKSLPDVETDEDIREDDDEEWPSKIFEGVEYLYNDSDKILIDKATAEQIGYLDDDGTIEYIGNGEETHEKNKENL